MKAEKYMRLSKMGFGLSLGITWALSVMAAGWFSIWGCGALMVKTLSSMYLGYSSGFVGGIVGGIWGFADGFIGGFVFSWLYNFFCSKRK